MYVPGHCGVIANESRLADGIAASTMEVDHDFTLSISEVLRIVDTLLSKSMSTSLLEDCWVKHLIER